MRLAVEPCKGHNCQYMNITNDENTTATATAKARTICKLGLDVHAASIMVARQVEGLNPQPPQKFKVAEFLKWVKGQMDKGFALISCYEAGPTGYWLHRQLKKLGVTNYGSVAQSVGQNGAPGGTNGGGHQGLLRQNGTPARLDDEFFALARGLQRHPDRQGSGDHMFQHVFSHFRP